MVTRAGNLPVFSVAATVIHVRLTHSRRRKLCGHLREYGVCLLISCLVAGLRGGEEQGGDYLVPSTAAIGDFSFCYFSL